MKTNKLQKRLKNLKKAFTNYGKAIRKATSKFHGKFPNPLRYSLSLLRYSVAEVLKSRSVNQAKELAQLLP